MDRVVRSQVDSARKLLEREAVDLADMTFRHAADLFYRGQSHTMRVEVESPGFDASAVEAPFVDLYLKRFEISLPEMEPMVLNLRTTAIGHRPKVDLRVLSQAAGSSLGEARTGSREVYFGGNWRHTAVYRRERLPSGAEFEGPAIIEQADTTVVVDPGSRVAVDDFGNLAIDVSGRA